MEEEKLEVVCGINIVKRVLKKIRKFHPYEEPGIDIILLIDKKIYKNIQLLYYCCTHKNTKMLINKGLQDKNK